MSAHGVDDESVAQGTQHDDADPERLHHCCPLVVRRDVRRQVGCGGLMQ